MKAAFSAGWLLSVDEMILALRSSIAGLCKLSGIDAPLEAQIEHIAIGAFDNIKSIEIKPKRPVLSHTIIESVIAERSAGGRL